MMAMASTMQEIRIGRLNSGLIFMVFRYLAINCIHDDVYLHLSRPSASYLSDGGVFYCFALN